MQMIGWFKLGRDVYSILVSIDKSREIRTKKQIEEDNHARIIIGIISAYCTGDPKNILDSENRKTDKSPLQKVRLILQQYKENYQGSIFAARKEFEAKMIAIPVAKTKKEVTEVIAQIEKNRIQVEGLYAGDIQNKKYYTDEDLIHYLLERTSDNSKELTSLRDTMLKCKNDSDTWTTVRKAIVNDIKDSVKSLDNYANTVSAQQSDIQQGLVLQTQLQKNTGVCYSMRNSGFCKRGSYCRFSHDEAAIKSAKEMDNNKKYNNNNNEGNNYNTRNNDRDANRYNTNRGDSNNNSNHQLNYNNYNNQSQDRKRDRQRSNSIGKDWESRSPSRSGSPIRERSGKRQPGTPLENK